MHKYEQLPDQRDSGVCVGAAWIFPTDGGGRMLNCFKWFAAAGMGFRPPARTPPGCRKLRQCDLAEIVPDAPPDVLAGPLREPLQEQG